MKANLIAAVHAREKDDSKKEINMLKVKIWNLERQQHQHENATHVQGALPMRRRCVSGPEQNEMPTCRDW
jgi:hypothetical protein